MTTDRAFVFLREDGESNNDATARCAREVLATGPMSRKVRKEDYRAFIEAGFIDTPSAPVFASKGTNCAIFVRGCLVCAEVKPRKGRPRITGITSWLGVGWFTEHEWIPIEKLDELKPGDVLYWCGWPGATLVQWRSATNGHVGIVLEADGWMCRTAEGGGADGLCRMNAEPKDVRLSWKRPLRGVWRPDNMSNG